MLLYNACNFDDKLERRDSSRMLGEKRRYAMVVTNLVALVRVGELLIL